MAGGEKWHDPTLAEWDPGEPAWSFVCDRVKEADAAQRRATGDRTTFFFILLSHSR